MHDAQPKWITAGLWQSFGCTRCEMWGTFNQEPTKENGLLEARIGSHRVGDAWPAVPLPYWSRLAKIPEAGSTHIEVEHAHGWPMRSMWTGVLQYDAAAKRYIEEPRSGLHGHQIAGPRGVNPNLGGRLPVTIYPLQPIAFGFAVNTLLYAASLWLLFAAPFVLRGRRRIRRGLCPACAYPIGDSAICTECGRRLKRS